MHAGFSAAHSRGCAYRCPREKHRRPQKRAWHAPSVGRLGMEVDEQGMERGSVMLVKGVVQYAHA